MNKIVIKNIRQVKTIRDVLHMERQRFLAELIKTNLQIQVRTGNVNKVFAYLVKLNNLAYVKTKHGANAVPYHLQVLSHKMMQLLLLEQLEITKLSVIDRALSERIRNIDRKITLMSMFETPYSAKKTTRSNI
jgi:hypothetical protein